jgi:hypothetical protein
MPIKISSPRIIVHDNNVSLKRELMEARDETVYVRRDLKVSRENKRMARESHCRIVPRE